VLGNVGENFYLHPDEQNPVKLWINDFNNNGSEDKILTRTYNKRDVPVFLKNDMQEEIPTIKKGNLKHKEYAKKSIQELFTSDLINKSMVQQFNYPSSCIAINDGKGNFTVQKLPGQAQLSIVNAILCMDINKDGAIDLVLGGNRSGYPPQFGKLDASYGDVLINDGKGAFTCLPATQTGLMVNGEVRDIVELSGKSNRSILFLRNNDFPVLYGLNN
jgi:hypothetical protein